MKLLITTILFTLTLFIVSCSNTSENMPQIGHDSIIATYPNDSLNIGELSNYIVNNSIQVNLNSENTLTRYKELIHFAAIEKQMLYEANLAGVNELTSFKIINAETKKREFVNQYLSDKKSKISITNQDIEDYFNENSTKYNLPEERFVYHFFKSNATENALKEIENVRKRIEDGESFKSLASKHSDSETRHREGLLGKIKKGDYNEQLDDIIFRLDVNQLSPVVKTKDGYHLFLVSEKLNAKNYEIHEISNIIKKDLYAEIFMKLIKDSALSVSPLPEPMMIATESELKEHMKSNSLQQVLYEIGEKKLTVGEFIFLLQESFKHIPHFDINNEAFSFFQETAYSEIIYQHMLDKKIELIQPEVLSEKTNKLILNDYQNIKLKSYINKNPKLIKEYFETNKKRYVTTIKVNMQILTIPQTTGDNIMPDLEMYTKKLNNNQLTLSELSKKYNGNVITSGLMSFSQLSALNRNIKKYANQLEVNQHSPPFTTKGFYNIIKLTDKTAPETNALPLVREQVVNDYIKNYKAQIFNDISKTYINEIMIDEDVLTTYIDSIGKLNDL